MKINVFCDWFLWVTKTVTIVAPACSSSFFHDFHTEKLPEDYNELNLLSSYLLSMIRWALVPTLVSAALLLLKEWMYRVILTKTPSSFSGVNSYGYTYKGNSDKIWARKYMVLSGKLLICWTGSCWHNMATVFTAILIGERRIGLRDWYLDLTWKRKNEHPSGVCGRVDISIFFKITCKTQRCNSEWFKTKPKSEDTFRRISHTNYLLLCHEQEW